MAVDEPGLNGGIVGKGSPHALEAYLHSKIPLTGAMGVRVASDTTDALRLSAPFAPNKNALDTAFGGSLVSLAILAGYGVTWQLIHNGMDEGSGGPSIVIRDVQAGFRRSVIGDLVAVCRRPSADEADAFRAALQRFRMAKLTLHPEIVDDAGRTALKCEAVYVVSVPLPQLA